MPSFKIDENNIVIAVMSFPPCEPDALPLAHYDTNIIGKRYDSAEATFHDVPKPSAISVDEPVMPSNEQ